MADGRNGHKIDVKRAGWPTGRKSIAQKAYKLFMEQAELTDDLSMLLARFTRNGCRDDIVKESKRLILQLIVLVNEYLSHDDGELKLDPNDGGIIVPFVTCVLMEMITPEDSTIAFQAPHPRTTVLRWTGLVTRL